MWQEQLSLPSGGRLVIAAIVIVGLVILGQVSLAATHHQPWLGVRVTDTGGQLSVTWVQPASLAWDAGVRPGDTIIAVDGRPVRSSDSAATIDGASFVRAQSATDKTVDASIDASVTISQQRRVIFLAIAMCFLTVSSTVFVLAEATAAARAMLGFGATAATMLIAAIATPFGTPWMLGIEYVAVIGFAAMTFLLFLVFPINRLGTDWGRGAATTGLVINVALVVFYGWVVLVDSAAYQVLQRVGLVVMVAEFVGAIGLVIAAVARTTAQQREARRALGLIALGTVTGLTPFCLLSLVPRLLGLGYIVRPDVAILSVVLLPVSLGAAVLSRQFFGITRLVRRSLLTLVVWTGLIASFSVALESGLSAVGSRIAALAPVVDSTMLIVALVAVTFWPIQHWLRRELEQLLFRDVYSYTEMVQGLGSEIVRLASADDIARHVIVRLVDTLDLTWAAIGLNSVPTMPIVRWGDCPRDLDPGALIDHGEGTPRGFEVAQLVPLVAKGTIIGALAIGPKRRDVELLPDDRTLISTLAPMIATALQNALLVRRLEAQVATLGDREHALAALSTRLLQVQEEERQSLALDLHDDPLQRAVLLARKLNDTPKYSPEHLVEAAEEIVISLRAICTGLRPPVLDDLGLVAGLDRLLHDIQARSDLCTALITEPADNRSFQRLDARLETALYRVAQEALNNCLKHAQATHVTVTLSQGPDWVRLQVADNGLGLNGTGSPNGGSLHLGILGMQERLRPWRGCLTMKRGSSGGTVVSAEVPLGGSNGQTTR